MSDPDNTPPVRRRYSTDNDKLLTAVAAKCRGIVRAEDVSGVVPDPLNGGRVRFSLCYTSDEVEQAIDSYPDFSVDVADYESAAQLVRSIIISAKRRAQALPLTGVAQRRRVQAEAEARGLRAQLDAVARAQRIGRARAEDNGDVEGEAE